MDNNELQTLKREIIVLERKLISEHERTKNYCVRCKELCCDKYVGHIRYKVGILQKLYELKRILKDA